MCRLLIPAVSLLFAMNCPAATQAFDVVVYGGTAGGIIAAVAAAREGLRTVVLEPTNHVGGMVSGGLGYTDFGKKETIGGYAWEFYFRVGRYYQMNRYSAEVSWYHEPHVAEQVFREMMTGAGVKLVEKARLRETAGVRRDGTRVVSLDTDSGDTYTAQIFIDASYEGDLMAQSGVTWVYGRESSAQYGETLAGVRSQTPLHQFLVDVPARGPDGKLLPGITSREHARATDAFDPLDRPAACCRTIGGAGLAPAQASNNPAPPGSADKAVQAYNFRMCFSEAADRVPFAKPADYDPAEYTLLAKLVAARMKAEGKVPALTTVIFIGRLPNGTTDVNNNGAFSTDYIGGSWTYPNAGYAERDRIWQRHKRYSAGLYYFLANDPQIPEQLRNEMKQWGLCRNEFADNEHWPYQIYIREDRRMVGEYVMRQQDMQTELTKPDVIGMGSYNSDSHNVQRIVGPDGMVRNEGDMQVAVSPYQIPYRILTPKRVEATNLLVPVAFSATHVAYSSVRMEPQYMILGQAAGVAAKMAIDAKIPVQAIDTNALTAKLRTQGAVMEYVPSPHATALSRARLAK